MNILDLLDSNNTIFTYPIENIEIIKLVDNKEPTNYLDINNLN